jgi:hypothetical protein
MAPCVIAAGLALASCIATVAWCFVLIKAVAWLSNGIAALAHSVGN